MDFPPSLESGRRNGSRGVRTSVYRPAYLFSPELSVVSSRSRVREARQKSGKENLAFCGLLLHRDVEAPCAVYGDGFLQVQKVGFSGSPSHDGVYETKVDLETLPAKVQVEMKGTGGSGGFTLSTHDIYKGLTDLPKLEVPELSEEEMKKKLEAPSMSKHGLTVSKPSIESKSSLYLVFLSLTTRTFHPRVCLVHGDFLVGEE